MKHRLWVDKLSKRTGYNTVVLPFATRDFNWGYSRIFEASPREFLGLIEGAEIVCTDSYHGMLFSINFNNFVLFCLKHTSKRLESIHVFLRSSSVNLILAEGSIGFTFLDGDVVKETV